MGWYPLIDDEHLSFPEELREKVIQTRLKSRSKFKNRPEEEFEWAIFFCEEIGYSGGNKALCFLGQRWRLRRQSNWQVEIVGPHVYKHKRYPNDQIEFWKTITEMLKHHGLPYDDTRYKWYWY